MSPILLAIILVIAVYILPKLLKFFIKFRRQKEFASKIPGIPVRSFFLGNAPDVPKEHESKYISRIL